MISPKGQDDANIQSCISDSIHNARLCEPFLVLLLEDVHAVRFHEKSWSRSTAFAAPHMSKSGTTTVALTSLLVQSYHDTFYLLNICTVKANVIFVFVSVINRRHEVVCHCLTVCVSNQFGELSAFFIHSGTFIQASRKLSPAVLESRSVCVNQRCMSAIHCLMGTWPTRWWQMLALLIGLFVSSRPYS
jgi:hypothetical protein